MKVGGVNDYAKRSHHHHAQTHVRKEDEENFAEGADRESEIKGAKDSIDAVVRAKEEAVR